MIEATIPAVLRERANNWPNEPIQFQKDGRNVFQPTSFKELYTQTRQFAAGLQKLGIKRGDNVGLIADNRQQWLVADLAIQCLGGADVPRGCDSTADEISYILDFSGCTLAILENQSQLEKVINRTKKLKTLKKIIIIDPGYKVENNKIGGLKIFAYAEILKNGSETNLAIIDAEIDKGAPDDVMTIIYTSGTTGEPKGVMLTHRNFLHQVQHVYSLIGVGAGDRWLSVLPVWHSFERVMQYVAIGSRSAICYSKPVGSILLADMQLIKPTWMASVPRIWESVRDGVYRNVKSEGGIKKALFLFFVSVGSAWNLSIHMVRRQMPRFRKRSRLLDFIVGIIPAILLWPLKALGNALVFKKIKAKLGGHFVAGVSGGGALPAHVDKFFQSIGVLLLEGYGLTESAPVLSLRSFDRHVSGTIGKAFPGTVLKIIGEDGKEAEPGEIGVLHARGPQIMKGYYRRDDLTAQIIDRNGFLNTGDLAMVTYDGDYKIVGRAKDTIVLLSGEGVEPAPIEARLKYSPYISLAVLVGQDRHLLGALIEVDPENLKIWAGENHIIYAGDEELFTSPEVHRLISEEISNLISAANGFKIYERIAKFAVLPRPFEQGRELSAKQEIKRHVVSELYAKEIESLFDNKAN